MIRRVLLDFSHEAFDQLKDLRRRAGVETNAGLIRDALRFLAWYTDKRLRGYDVYMYHVVDEIEVRPTRDFEMAIGILEPPARKRRWWEGWW